MIAPTKSASTPIARLLSDWSRLGLLVNALPSRRPPDVEQTLLSTARLSAANIRLFTLAGTWLKSFGTYVGGHRLRKLISVELDPSSQANLGLLLDWADVHALRIALSACTPATNEKPYADVESRSRLLHQLSRSRATPLSRKWGRWLSEDAFEPKPEALRPINWVTAHNPLLTTRALLGSVAASILAEWPQGGVIDSEADISRTLGATRLAVSDALATLQLGGLVTLSPHGRRTQITIHPAA